MRTFFTIVALALLAVVNAAIINVSVGPNNTLTYSPNSVTAQNGDLVVFTFESKNHTVTQSTFTDPCTPLSSGANSGFHPASNTSHPTFNFTVTNASTPDWFFCEQTGHCFEGMVFAINPTANKSFGAFQAKAESLNPSNTGSSSSLSFASGSPTGTGSSASPSASTESSAMKLGGSTLSILFLAIFVFGLVL